MSRRSATIGAMSLGARRHRGGARGHATENPQGGRRPSGVVDATSSAWQLVVNYAKQETLEPLKGLGRYLIFAVAAGVLGTAAALFWILAVLRVLQDETGSTFHGHLSWLPYMITIVVALMIAGVTGWRILRGEASRGGESLPAERS